MKIVKWLALGLVCFVALVVASVFAASEWRLARTYEAPAFAMRTAQAGSAERGARWSRVIGCQGCHGPSGRVLFEAPNFARLVAPNISRLAADYSDAELGTLIRHGIKRDGTSALAMPADAYSNLADEDLADILAWVRSLPSVPDAADLPQTSWGPIGRVSVLMGGAPFSADMARTSDPPVRRPNGDKEGEYLTKVTCLHCHRLDEEHEVKPGLKSPPVRPVVQGYELSQFLALMRTGKGVGDRELELMSTVARNDLSRMTEAELTAIYTYLTAQEPAGSGEAQPKQETQ